MYYRGILYTQSLIFYISEILNVDPLPDATPLIEDIVGYDWHIDTKYYTADIQLCCTSSRTIGNEAFAEEVHAFIVYFNADEVKLIYFFNAQEIYLTV